MTVDDFRAWLDEHDVPGTAEIFLPDDRGGYPVTNFLAYQFGHDNPMEVHLS